MDYAKLALIKAEELKKRGILSKDSEISRTGLIFDKQISALEVVSICALKGIGAAGIIVSLAIENFEDKDGQWLDFIVGSKVVFSRPLSKSIVFMASINLDKKVNLKLKASCDIKLVSADVMVIGGQILNLVAYGVSVAKQNDIICAAFINDDCVRVSVSDSQNLPSLNDYNLVGFGITTSVCAFKHNDEDCFMVLHTDNQKNVFLSKVLLSGKVAGFKLLNIKADTGSIISVDGSKLIVGYCLNGYAYAGIASFDDGCVDYCLRLEEATAIEFVRSCNPPAVILTKKQNNVIRLPQREESCTDLIKMQLSIQIEV